MEFGTIEREVFVEASPETVFEVVSRPEHVREWWPDEADYEPVAGSTGHVAFGEPGAADRKVEAFTVVEVTPPERFAFRWTHPQGDEPRTGNSYLVTFELAPSGTGTRLRMTETGFRERGWDDATVEHEHRDHVSGWDHFLARIGPYTASLVRP